MDCLKTSITSRFVLILTILLFSIGLVSCSEGAKEQVKTLDKVSIRLQWIHQAQFAGIYTAKEEGFYEENGIDLTINSGGMDFNAIKLVATGNDTFGIWNADQIIISRTKGIPIRAIAVVYQKSQTVFMVKKESGIKTPHDFIGQTVGMYYGWDSETYYKAMLKKLGIDRKRIREVPVQYDLARFFEDEVDVWPAYVINQPILAEERGFPVSLIYPADYGVVGYSDTIFTRESLINENPDLVLRFLKATLKGWEYALTHQEEAIDYTLKYAKDAKREHQKKMLEVSVPFIKPPQQPRVGWMDKNVWDNLQSFLLDEGIIKTRVPDKDIYRMKFLNEIYLNK
ncbi:MAG: ABC transporter substrate-binding protein [Thermodesulfobacteriota bacterium]|nr:ABC transporter substrate-binding protein [Thermodesulfobacteriota bacterium]